MKQPGRCGAIGSSPSVRAGRRAAFPSRWASSRKAAGAGALGEDTLSAAQQQEAQDRLIIPSGQCKR